MNDNLIVLGEVHFCLTEYRQSVEIIVYRENMGSRMQNTALCWVQGSLSKL